MSILPEYLTPAEIADQAGVHPNTVRRAILAGKFTHVYLIPPAPKGLKLVPVADAKRYIRAARRLAAARAEL
jgi:hypothetical protein